MKIKKFNIQMLTGCKLFTLPTYPIWLAMETRSLSCSRTNARSRLRNDVTHIFSMGQGGRFLKEVM
jgi:hypothetical protein